MCDSCLTAPNQRGNGGSNVEIVKWILILAFVTLMGVWIGKTIMKAALEVSDIMARGVQVQE